MSEYGVACMAARNDRVEMLVDAESIEEAREKALNRECKGIEDPRQFSPIPPDLEIIGVEEVPIERDGKGRKEGTGEDIPSRAETEAQR